MTRPALQPAHSQRRGDRLRDHVLLAAKEVFLDVGFERASMDAVAARAQTSKRSLYAHFESKDKLFLAVLELVGELYLDHLKTPDAYADEPREAVALFCARFQQLLAWERQVRTCRLCISEADRLPVGANPYWTAVFEPTYARLADYLVDRFALDPAAAASAARALLDAATLPRLFRCLGGVEQPLADMPDEGSLTDDVDLVPIRDAVGRLLPRPCRVTPRKAVAR